MVWSRVGLRSVVGQTLKCVRLGFMRTKDLQLEFMDNTHMVFFHLGGIALSDVTITGHEQHVFSECESVHTIINIQDINGGVDDF